jgi:hypothetical protein
VIVSTPVTSQRGDDAGAVALATPIDLGPVTTQLGGHVTTAELRGLDGPVTLVGGKPTGPVTELPLNLPKELGVTAVLATTLPPMVAAEPVQTFAWVRLGCWGLAGILAVLYFVNLLRARRAS